MNNYIDELNKLKALYEQGAITETEFQELKQQIINRNGRKPLAEKKIWAVILWAIFFPIGAYAYTRRWKALWITLACLFGVGFVIGAASDDVEEAFATSFAVGSVAAPLAAGIDNSVAISRARKSKQFE